MIKNDSKDPKRYIYSGGANSIAATIQQPARHCGRVLKAPTASLPTIGGYIHQTKKDIRIGEVVSVKQASVSVLGERRQKGQDDDHYFTHAVATLRGVNILDRVTAKAIVGSVTSIYYVKGAHHPDPKFHKSRFYFQGYFDGLKIDGKRYEPVLSESALKADKHPSPIMAEIKSLVEGHRPICTNVEWEDDPYVYVERDAVYNTHSLIEPRVNKPFLTIQQFGTIYWGEVDIFKSKATQTMLRIELGCPYQGSIAAATTTTNGHDG